MLGGEARWGGGGEGWGGEGRGGEREAVLCLEGPGSDNVCHDTPTRGEGGLMRRACYRGEEGMMRGEHASGEGVSHHRQCPAPPPA